MVLSNKKLKQKLRSELVESLAASVRTPDPNANNNGISDANPQNQSLKELLDSVTQKPRLSKREKRRKNLSFKGLESSDAQEKRKRRKVEEESEENKEVGIVGVGENNENGGEHEEGEKKKKKKKQKRKRGDMESKELGGDEVGEGVVKEAKKSNKKKRKKEKNKKKKKQKQIKEDKIGSEVQGIAESIEAMDIETVGIIPTKVYVGGIPYYYSEDDIRSYFKGCGTITDVECKMRSEDDMFTGIAFITFQTEDAAKRALAFDRAAMGERFLTIQQYRKPQVKKSSGFAPEMVEGYNRIYVGNLSWDITEEDLRKFFSDCNITSIRFGLGKETGDFRGYAHVDFKDSFSVVMALKLNQEILCGRPVKISCAVPRKSVNTHSRSMPIKVTASTKSKPTNCVASSKAEPPSDEMEDGGADNSNSMPGFNSMASGGGADNGNPMPTSGKIRRRTCYECGQKGHLSSACPNKKTVDASNSGET